MSNGVNVCSVPNPRHTFTGNSHRSPARMSLPIGRLTAALKASGLSRLLDMFAQQFPDDHLKDLVVDVAGPGRAIEINGRRVTNFGCDSFLGLDRDARAQRSVVDGVRRWGTHNG